MADQQHRVVIFSSEDSDFISTQPSVKSIDYIPVHHGYDAAAELLSKPPLAMVVDLPYLTSNHTELLDIARSRGVKMMGIGGFPQGLSADKLCGMHLVAARQIPIILNKMAEQE